MDRVAVPTATHPVAAARLDWAAMDAYVADRYLAHLAAGVPVHFALANAKADLTLALGQAPA